MATKVQLFVAVSAVLLVAGAGVDAFGGHKRSKYPPSDALLDRIVSAPQYSTLVAALKASGLIPTVAELLKTTPITIFAPDNKAFKKVPRVVLNYLLSPEGKPALIDILKYHVVAGSVPKPYPGQTLQNLLNLPLTISLRGWLWKKLYVNNVKIEKPALLVVPQGVVHGIDEVLVPPQYVPVIKALVSKGHGYKKGYGGHHA